MPELNHGELTISSPAFGAEVTIPERFANGGDDIPPPLEWTGVPDGCVELVLVVHDPDAPLVDGFTHWIVSGIDPSSGGLETDVDAASFTVGRNTIGDAAYMGPAPPAGHGLHHYFFHLYAIDTASGLDADASRSDVLAAIDGHIIEQARLVGTYALRG